MATSIAMQAARLAGSNVGVPRSPPSSSSTPAAPPPPPPPAPPSSAPPPPTSREPPAATNRARAGSNLRSTMLDPSAYTLSPTSNGSGGGSKSPSPAPGGKDRDKDRDRDSGYGGGIGGPRERIIVHDPRWRFPDESQLPKPRPFQGGPRRYRAGRGSSVPLDLSAL